MTSAAVTPVFDYAPARSTPRRRVALARLILSLPALVAPFLDFQCGVSPMEAAASVVEPDGWADNRLAAAMGAGFFAGFIVLAWRAALLLRPHPGRSGKRLAVASMLLAWLPYAATTAFWSWALIQHLAESGELPSAPDILPFLTGTTVACAGILLAWRLWVAGNRSAAFLAALTTPFLANAALCLHGFYDDAPQAGYYVTAYLVLLWSSELAWEALRQMRNRWRSWREDSGPIRRRL
jgi:hypothetical protein